MNAAQIHLALNHAPLFLAIAGAITLIIGMFRKNESYKILSLYTLAGAALFTVPVFLTGDGTEESVEGLPGVAESAISQHEEMAKIALIIIIFTGVIALAGIFLRKKESMMKVVYGMALLFSLASFGAMAQTAHLGGLIRHTEIGNATNTGKEGKDAAENEEKGEMKQTLPADSTAKTVKATGEKKGKDNDD